jgi:hypothetical protein
MAIQYSGLTLYNNTFTMATGTRQEVVNGLAAALLSAGWTQVAGSVGSTDQTFKSATTPQGYAIRIRLLEPGTGNCAQVFLQNATGSLAQTTNPGYLLPTASGTFRVIANAYQFFIFEPGTITTRKHVAAGVPYVFSFLTGSITAVGWLIGDAASDTDTTARASFRTRLNSTQSGGNVAVLSNANIWSSTAGSSTTIGSPMLIVPLDANLNTTPIGYTYFDGSALIADPLLSLGNTGGTDTGTIRGQLWDASVISDAFTADITATFDSHNWFNLTSNNTGTTGQARGSLFLVVP